MRHREILKHKEQQAAYLTNRGNAKIAERRQTNRKTQHSKEHIVENTSNTTQQRAGAKLSRCINATSRYATLNQPHHQKRKNHLLTNSHLIYKYSTNEPKPKHDTEKDTSMSKTHWGQATMGHVIEQLFKRG